MSTQYILHEYTVHTARVHSTYCTSTQYILHEYTVHTARVHSTYCTSTQYILHEYTIQALLYCMNYSNCLPLLEVGVDAKGVEKLLQDCEDGLVLLYSAHAAWLLDT